MSKKKLTEIIVWMTMFQELVAGREIKYIASYKASQI